MAIRRWAVPPDQPYNTQDGQIGVVSREALENAVLDGVSILDRAGGSLMVQVGRAPTGVPHEMVTTGVVVQWQDRTDARPQAEPASDVLPAHAAQDDETPEAQALSLLIDRVQNLPPEMRDLILYGEAEPPADEPVGEPDAAEAAPAQGEVIDSLDRVELPEEDDSELEAATR